MFIIKRNDTRNYPSSVTFLVRITTPRVNTDTEFCADMAKAKRFESVAEANSAIERLYELAKKNGWRTQISPMYSVEGV